MSGEQSLERTPQQERQEAQVLSPKARYAAAAFLAALGTLGIVRGLVAPPGALTPSDPALPLGARAWHGAEDLAAGSAARAGAVAGDDGRALPASAADGSVARKVNINTASAAELDLLPGIGPTLAARIIADREANGLFKTLGDLDRVPRIGPKTIADLAPYATAE